MISRFCSLIEATHYYSLTCLHVLNSGHIQHAKSKYSINLNKQTRNANNKLTKKTITPHALFTNKERIFTYKSVFTIVVTLEK